MVWRSCCQPSIGQEIWLRRITKLDEEQQKTSYQLQLQLPERLDPIHIHKCRSAL